MDFPLNAGVAPLAGAWIETYEDFYDTTELTVAPLAGAWIETTHSAAFAFDFLSHPSRVRGLKRLGNAPGLRRGSVAPLAGAWIETVTPAAVAYVSSCRTPRGCVD